MELISSKDLAKATSVTGLGGDIFSKIMMQVLSLNELNSVYSNLSDAKGLDFINAVIEVLGIKFEFNEEELKRLPTKGAFITVSNHPLGGADGILLLKLLTDVRPDFKVLANFLLQKIKPIEDCFIGVNPFDDERDLTANIKGLKLALEQLQAGSPVGIFPAGEVSTYRLGKKKVADREWQPSAIKFIRKAQVPVVPIYFEGFNSRLFYLLARIHPLLRTAKLPSELLNKNKKTIKIRIGTPISVKEQNEFEELEQYGRFLRAKTYSLGSKLDDVKKFFRPRVGIPVMQKKLEPIAMPVDRGVLLSEVEHLKKKHMLFDSKTYSVICPPATSMPSLMHELGRLREITFREVGEGTNNSLDLDEYDLYYHQLVIWDNEANAVVGAYRVGKGKDILAAYGSNGFYIRSLFRTEAEFDSVLNQSLELGRSFVVKEYQRKPMSLFLLWKGILYLLLKNPEYRYLIGPVSISNDFSVLSKNLIVSFIKSNHFNSELSKLVRPRKEFVVKSLAGIDPDIILQNSNGDIDKLDKLIQDIETHLKLPVLVKKYIHLNAKIIGFNVDPKFNNCLDGFLLLDIFDIPMDVVESLSKEIKDAKILDRFHVAS